MVVNRHLPAVNKIEKNDQLGAAVTVGKRTYTVTFATTGPVGGHMKITERDKVILDRPLADKVEDNYRKWSADPRFKDWMTNPHMKTVVDPKK